MLVTQSSLRVSCECKLHSWQNVQSINSDCTVIRPCSGQKGWTGQSPFGSARTLSSSFIATFWTPHVMQNLPCKPAFDIAIFIFTTHAEVFHLQANLMRSGISTPRSIRRESPDVEFGRLVQKLHFYVSSSRAQVALLNILPKTKDVQYSIERNKELHGPMTFAVVTSRNRSYLKQSP